MFVRLTSQHISSLSLRDLIVVRMLELLLIVDGSHIAVTEDTIWHRTPGDHTRLEHFEWTLIHVWQRSTDWSQIHVLSLIGDFNEMLSDGLECIL